MSELVAHKADVTIPVYGTIADAEVYLKSKADKVIAHHKYKRCLAMAVWCEAELEKLDYKNTKDYTDKDVWKIATSYYTIWRKRWLELAEKFKPNNSTAQ